MDHVVVSFHPFDFKQQVMIYQNGECKKVIPVTVDELSEAIVNICNTYNIDTVDIRGEKQFTEKFKEEIKKQNLTIYNKNNLKITLY